MNGHHMSWSIILLIRCGNTAHILEQYKIPSIYHCHMPNIFQSHPKEHSQKIIYLQTIRIQYQLSKMQDTIKSALVVGQPTKKQQQKQAIPVRQIQYKQVANMHDYIGQLSDQQKEAEFYKQHQQYIKMKAERKKELIRIKREEFGTSSSEDNADSSQEEIEEVKGTKKLQSQRSKGKLQSQRSKGKLQSKIQSSNQSVFSVTFELKKTSIQTQLHLFQKEFQINNRTFQYSKTNKLSIFKTVINNKNVHKLRIGIDSDEIIINLNEKNDHGKIMDIFLRIFTKRLENTNANMDKTRNSVEDFGQLKEGALIYDKIYKKSQVIGKWQQRFIIIKPQGLFSYRSLKEKPTMHIPLPQITELLTTFEFYKQTQVVKLFYNNTKTDFGLPLDQKLTWLTHFVNLLKMISN